MVRGPKLTTGVSGFLACGDKAERVWSRRRAPVSNPGCAGLLPKPLQTTYLPTLVYMKIGRESETTQPLSVFGDPRRAAPGRP